MHDFVSVWCFYFTSFNHSLLQGDCSYVRLHYTYTDNRTSVPIGLLSNWIVHPLGIWMQEQKVNVTGHSSVYPKMKNWTDTPTAPCGPPLTRCTSWGRCLSPPTTSASPARKRRCVASSSLCVRWLSLFLNINVSLFISHFRKLDLWNKYFTQHCHQNSSQLAAAWSKSGRHVNVLAYQTAPSVCLSAFIRKRHTHKDKLSVMLNHSHLLAAKFMAFLNCLCWIVSL